MTEHYVHDSSVLLGLTIFSIVAAYVLMVLGFFCLWCCCFPPEYASEVPTATAPHHTTPAAAEYLFLFFNEF